MILVNVFVIIFEAEDDMSVAEYFHQFYLILHDSLLFAHIFDPEKVFIVGIVNICFIQSPC